MAPVTLKFLLTKTWCGRLILIMWTAYEPSLSFSKRLTVPPGVLGERGGLGLVRRRSGDDPSRPGTPVLRDLTDESLVPARLHQRRRVLGA
jgi:hypothetical protein